MKKGLRGYSIFQISEKERLYFSNLCIASAQVFLGVAVGTLFTGPSDFVRIMIVILNFTLAIGIAVLGKVLL